MYNDVAEITVVFALPCELQTAQNYQYELNKLLVAGPKITSSIFIRVHLWNDGLLNNLLQATKINNAQPELWHNERFIQ